MRRNLRKAKRWLKTAGLLAAGAALLAGCSLTPGTKQADKERPPSIQTVNVAEVAKQRIGDPLEIQAEVIPSVEMEVSSSLSGIVSKLFKNRGDLVREGDVIVHVDSKELQQQLDNANIGLSQAKSELSRVKRNHSAAISQFKQSVQLATNNYNQVRNAYDSGSATDAELDAASKLLSSAKTNLEVLRQQQLSESASAEGGVQSAQLAVNAAQQALAEMNVKAPISGILTELIVEPGSSIQADVAIGFVQNLESVKLAVSLPPSSLDYAKEKSELSYLLPSGGQTKPAPISYLSPNPNPKTGNYELELTVPNADKSLKPGNKLKVRLTEEEEQIVLAIPTKSVLKDTDGAAYVYVFSEGTVKKRKVELGRVNEPLQEVLSGLEEKESIVVSGINQLHDNEKVQLPSAKP